MAYDISIKQRAIRLRQAGFSIKEIARKLKIAQSSSSLWLRNIKISEAGKARMIKHKELNRYKMSQVWIEKRRIQRDLHIQNANKLLQNTNLKDKKLTKIISSLLFWAEGNKDFSHIRFTNSDPKMVLTFINSLRNSYELDEAKFRACIHLHEYHDNNKLHNYWSETTNIPLSQFRKPYLKPHTGKRKKLNYMGCITIYYFDSSIAQELEALYNAIGSHT